MAKHEGKGIAVPVAYKERTRVMLDSKDELAKLNIGDKVTILIQGKVVSLEERQHYDDPKKVCREVCVEQDEVKVADGKVFAELADDED